MGSIGRWLTERAVKILEGKCNQVAKGIRISATRRKRADGRMWTNVRIIYLKTKIVKYGDALVAAGYSIASGVIEGA